MVLQQNWRLQMIQTFYLLLLAIEEVNYQLKIQSEKERRRIRLNESIFWAGEETLKTRKTMKKYLLEESLI